MNPNQLKLNLKTMKAPRQDHEIQTIKYYNFLLDLKYKIDNKNEVIINNFCRKNKVTTRFVPFLIKNKIVFRDENDMYVWNEKIPVTNLLIKKFRQFCREYQKKYRPTKNKEIIKNEPKLIKQRSKVHNIGKEETKVIYSVQKQEIGLIRKFLKWIY
jgi:hypothetical protein